MRFLKRWKRRMAGMNGKSVKAKDKMRQDKIFVSERKVMTN